MITRSHALGPWLRARKDANGIELDLMALLFDLEGALDAQQLGLAWISQEQILNHALRLYVAQRDPAAPSVAGYSPDHVAASIELVARWNAPLAARAWELVLRPVQLTPEGVEAAVAQTLAFVTHELHVAAGGSRAGATRAWAEGVDTLRRVAAKAGLAGSESWYLPTPDGEHGAAEWLDDVLSTLADD